MTTINTAMIIGNAAAAATVREFDNGGAVANLRVAVTETWKKDGERQERTEWVNVTIKNKVLAKMVGDKVEKGTKLFIQGAIETRSFEKDGQTRYVTELVVGMFDGSVQVLAKGGNASMNKVVLVGNMGEEPQLRSFQNGGKVANFRIATSTSYKKDGDYVDLTQWHNIAITNKGLADIAGSLLTKGTQVQIEGKLQTRSWTDSDGNTRYTTEVVVAPYAGEMNVISRGKRAEGGAKSEASNEAEAPSKDFDDEIPF